MSDEQPNADREIRIEGCYIARPGGPAIWMGREAQSTTRLVVKDCFFDSLAHIPRVFYRSRLRRWRALAARVASTQHYWYWLKTGERAKEKTG